MTTAAKGKGSATRKTSKLAENSIAIKHDEKKAKSTKATTEEQSGKKIGTSTGNSAIENAQKAAVSGTVSQISNLTSNNMSSMKPKDFTGIGYLGIPPYQEKEGEAYMSEPQREHFLSILLAWKKSLMEEVDRTISYLQKETIDKTPDPADEASKEENFRLELRAKDRERKLIKKIDESLELLEHNDYGYCDECGTEIGLRRLEARPTATLCIDCKTMDEIREKQTRGGL